MLTLCASNVKWVGRTLRPTHSRLPIQRVAQKPAFVNFGESM